MKQAIVRRGRVTCETVPAPQVSPGSVLIRVVSSCISAGTEISGVQASGRSLINSALEQPKRVWKAIDMARSIGIARAYAEIQQRFNIPTVTGYSVSGVVVAVGADTSGIAVGDAVAAAGAGRANHAEYVDVPSNLVVRMPPGMDFGHASTVALGAIALQGLRRANLAIGEFSVVVGAGILGLLTIQLLRQAGVRVATVDLDRRRLEIAHALGAEHVVNPTLTDPVREIENWTGGAGADAVVFAASTESSEPLGQAFQMCRRKGKVILVGVSGMQINREDIYAKELDFLVSTSYGPGRYDRQFEEKGLDYPYAYVRWTETRNMAEYLRLVSSGSLSLDRLIDLRFPIERVTEAFEAYSNSADRPLMVLLDYTPVDEQTPSQKPIVATVAPRIGKRSRIGFAIIGAGSFAQAMHLPNLCSELRDLYSLQIVVDRDGARAKWVAEKFGAPWAATTLDSAIDNPNVDLVIITTRHDAHASLALRALRAGKHVFVEKPMAVTHEEVTLLEQCVESSGDGGPVLMTGFNRRFSPHSSETRRHTNRRTDPLYVSYRMNAGYFPPEHWTHEAGGRIIGEACHMIDFVTSLTDCRVVSFSYEELTPATERLTAADNKAFVLKYEDGSVASFHYFATGHPSLGKERVEIHFDGKTILLDDYRTLEGWGVRLNAPRTAASEKGHLEEMKALHRSLTQSGVPWPIPMWDMAQTTRLTLSLAGQRAVVDALEFRAP